MRMTSQTNPVGNETVWVYDLLGRVESETNELNKTRYFTYNVAGQLLTRTDRLNRIIAYEYDLLGRTVKEEWSTVANATVTTRFEFEYDRNSRLTSADSYSVGSPNVYLSRNDYVYNPTGWLTSETVEPGHLISTLTHTYDLAGRTATTTGSFTIGPTTTSDFLTTYGRDAKGRITSIKQQSSGSGAGYSVVAPKYNLFAYNELDQITSIHRYANTTTSNLVAQTNLDRDYLGRLTLIDHFKGATHFSKYEIDYDAHHRIKSIDDVFSNFAWNETHDNTYDDTDQLTAADHSVQSDEAYAYDKNGNRTGNQTHLGATNSSTVTANNQISTDGVYNYTWDAEGNRITRTNISTGEKENYTYDHRNRLFQVMFRNSSNVVQKTISHRYDERNLMVRRIENIYTGGVAGTNTFDLFTHDGQQIVMAFHKGATGNAYLTNRFLWGPEVDQLLADEQVTSLASAGTVYWVLADQLGTVRDLVTYDSGLDTTTVVKHRTNDSFGNLVSDSAPGITVIFFYTAKIFDTGTGLQWNWERWYAPQLGKWISEDPIGFDGGDENLGRMVGNHPTYSTDPTGLIVRTPLEWLTEPPEPWYVVWIFRPMCEPDPSDFMNPLGVVSKPGFKIGKKVLVKVGEEATESVCKAWIRRFPAWKLHDSITKLTVDGLYPSWQLIRARYWMNRAATAVAGEFGHVNLAIMRNGSASKARVIVRMKDTLRLEEKLVEKELHHALGNRGTPGFDDPLHLREVWPWEHARIDPSRHLNYDFIDFKSNLRLVE